MSTYPDPVPPTRGNAITPSNLQPQRSVHDDAEYRRNHAASDTVNVLYAIDAGGTDNGIVVGLIDSGVQTAHTNEFDARIDEADLKNFGTYTDESGNVVARPAIGDHTSIHGTSTGAIIAAARDGYSSLT